MPNTPAYNWPYQALGDAPNGAMLGEKLALAIEATVSTATGAVGALQAAAPYTARQTLTSTAASVTFSGIPSNLRSLTLKYTARSNNAATTTVLVMRINGSSDAVYSHQLLQVTGSSLNPQAVGGSTSARGPALPGGTSTANLFGSGRIDFDGWDSPHANYLGFVWRGQNLADAGYYEDGGGVFASAGPYTSITLTPNAGSFVAGSDFQLWGDRNESAGGFTPGAALWNMAFSGTGTPEGAVTAPVGALYTRTDAGEGHVLYAKTSGAGNTGWVEAGGASGIVRAATTGNVTISTALNAGDVIDGVTLALNDLVLVKDQTAPAENGVYVVGVSPARDVGYNTYNEHAGARIVVQEGTVNADTTWLGTSNAGGTLNTTAITFVNNTGGAGIAIAANSLLGNNSGSSAVPSALTAAQVKTLLAIAEGDVTGLTADLAAKQPLDGDLTTIAGLTATTDNVMQAKAGAWASRTIAQLSADLAASGGVFQPLDTDLTTIAGLTATTDNMIQSVGSAWASRTPAQVKAALAIAQADVAGLVSELTLIARTGIVRAATTGNITIASALNNADVLDGVTLVTGDQVLVKDQTAPEENGIYVVGVTPTRASRFSTYNDHAGVRTTVQEGTVNADTTWLGTSNAGGTLNTTAITFLNSLWLSKSIGVLNVKAFGATGDGTTDDTAAINACLAAAVDGTTVYFPAGTYLLSKDASGYILKITKKYLTLVGQSRDATILKVKNAIGEYIGVITDGTTIGNTNLSGLTLRGMTIDGNQTNNTMADVSLGTGPIFNGFPRFALRVYTGTDGVIENVRFANFDDVNTISMNGGATVIKRWRIQNCLFENIGAGALHDHSTIYFHGVDVVIRDNTFTGAGNAAWTAIETHGPGQLVQGNVIKDFTKVMNITGVDVATSRDIIVTHNQGTGAGIGIQLWAFDYPVATPTLVGFALDRCLVANNQLEIDRDKWDSLVSFKAGIVINNGSTACARDLKIVDNQISYLPASSTGVANDGKSCGILWYRNVTVTEGTQDEEIEISRNTIIGSMGPGIHYQPAILAKRVRINDNLIVNPGMLTVSSALRVGIYLDTVTIAATDLYDVQINRNVVVDDNATHKVVCAIDTQNISGLTNGEILDNVLRVGDGTALPVIKGDTASAWYCRQAMPVYTANTGVFTAGSRVVETSTGLEYVQRTAPSGSSWTATPVIGLEGQRFKAGFYYTAPAVRSASSSQVFVKDKAYFVPFYVTETATFSRIGIRVATVQASTNGRLAIYADDGHGAPGALVLDAGTVDTATSAVAVEATISQQLNPGLYWLACVTQGGTTQPTLTATISPAPQVGSGSADNAAIGHSAYTMTGVTGSYGAYSAAGSTAFAPVIYMKVASVP